MSLDYARAMVIRLTVLLVVVLAGVSRAAGPIPQEALDDIARRVVTEHGVPAVGLLVAEGGAETVAVAGVRRAGEAATVEMGDSWHLGSCTKAITSLLAARLVDFGTITWDTTPADVLADLPPSVNAANANATLRQLLTHTSGLPGRESDLVVGLIAELRDNGQTSPAEQRLKVAYGTLSLEPTSTSGEAWAYCNGGYIVAGAMLEAAAGVPLEELFERELFEPLGITSAGWGPPSDVSGHLNGDPVPYDNPLAYDAAGRLHVSLTDWAKRCRATLGTPNDFLSDAAREALLTPASDAEPRYGLGWILLDLPPLGPTATHDGTNTFWYARSTLALDQDVIVLVAVNTFDPVAGNAALDTIIERVTNP